MSIPPGAIAVALPGGGDLVLPEEVPVALVYDGVTQAVMMATPADLEDFHLGFALTEGLIASAAELGAAEIVAQPRGIEVRGWLAAPAGVAFRERRRAMAGPVGCGLCGIDSLEQALRPLARAAGGSTLTPAHGTQALDDLRAGQILKDASRATHAAGFWTEARGLVMLREDVGRHNALDKLVGALVRAGEDASAGTVVMTSRVSVDLVQKAVAAGVGCLVAPSAPTALAVEQARAVGLRLIARAGRELALF